MHVTEQFHRLQRGDRDAMNALIPIVYEELKKLARAHLRRESNNVSLQTTALVHEAFLKLARSSNLSFESRTHFYGISSRLMRQVLVETARARAAEKRGAKLEVACAELPDRNPQPDRSVLALDDALQCLEKEDRRKAELVQMRYFGGLTAEESAMALSMPVHIVRRELRLAQAWLGRQMAGIGQTAGVSSSRAMSAAAC